MTVTNHALVGAIIGLTIKEPVLALPIALLSHFALDLLPHLGFKDWHERQKYKRLFAASTAVDMIAVLIFFIVSALFLPALASVCAFLALSPDLGWVYRFVIKENFGKNPPPPENYIERFHKKIQRYEFPRGVYIEIFFACLLAYVILQISP